MFWTVKSTANKHSKACREQKASLEVFKQLDASIDPARRSSWTKQEQLAMTHRGKHLSIYQVDEKKCIGKLSIIHFHILMFLQHQALIKGQFPHKEILNQGQARRIFVGYRRA
jgi:hypothetical protein